MNYYNISFYKCDKGLGVKGTYTQYVDINMIDHKIKEFLENPLSYEKDIQDLKHKLEKGCYNFIEYKKILKNIDEFKTKEANILTKEVYDNQISHIITNFNTKNSDKKKIFNEYISIMRKYIDVQLVHEITYNEKLCIDCDKPLNNITDYSGVTYCDNCFTEQNVIIKVPFMKDTDVHETDKIGKNREDDIFYKTILRYQGKQPDINPEIIKTLKKYFNNSHENKSEESKNKLILALQKTDNHQYYKDFNIIANHLWNWKLPNLSSINEEIILQDYDLSQPHYLEMKNIKKISLSNDVRLFFHMLSRNMNPEKLFFKLADTYEIITRQMHFFNEIALKVNIPTITSLT